MNTAPETIGLQLRRRRAYPGHDPEMDDRCHPLTRGTYGLTPAQLRQHAAWLREHGWQPWEVRARLARPEGGAA